MGWDAHLSGGSRVIAADGSEWVEPDAERDCFVLTRHTFGYESRDGGRC